MQVKFNFVYKTEVIFFSINTIIVLSKLTNAVMLFVIKKK